MASVDETTIVVQVGKAEDVVPLNTKPLYLEERDRLPRVRGITPLCRRGSDCEEKRISSNPLAHEWKMAPGLRFTSPGPGSSFVPCAESASAPSTNPAETNSRGLNNKPDVRPRRSSD